MEPADEDRSISLEERSARVLQERARALAQVPAPAADDLLPALAFDAGGERYAIPLTAVLRVERLTAVARLPGAPPGYLGLFALEGRPCPVVDVPALLGVPGALPAVRRWALVLGARTPDIAIAADEVGTELVPRARLRAGEGSRLGVTADARVVLDPDLLLRHPDPVEERDQ